VQAQALEDFDLLLAVKPDSSLAYGGRHITVATIKAQSRSTAAATLKPCNKVLTSSQGFGWRMPGPPTSCLGHMDPTANSCSDNRDWNLSKLVYGYTPVVVIASKQISTYADCILSLGGPNFQVSIKGPTSGTAWHCALYGSPNRNAADQEFQSMYASNPKPSWVPYLNGRRPSDPPLCPDALSPAGSNGKPGKRCWEWTEI